MLGPVVRNLIFLLSDFSISTVALMSDVIISVENLGKKYRIAHQGEKQRYVALRDVIANKVKGLFQNRKS